MLSTLNTENRAHWKDFVLTLIHAYKCMKSNTMDFSLHYLMYEQKHRLLLDLYLVPSQQTYVEVILKFHNQAQRETKVSL